MPKASGSIYHTDLHYLYHFGVMVFGGIICMMRNGGKRRRLWVDAVSALVSFVLYFTIMKFGKGQAGAVYYVQLLGLVPLYGFVYYLFLTFSHPCITRFAIRRAAKPVVLFLSNLTLEIYLVQQYVITDALNALFPLNTLIVFLLICGAAYLLHVFVQAFDGVMCGREITWKKVLDWR